MTITPWGVNGDRPLLADFNADGKQDLVIYRPSTGLWYVLNSGGAGQIFAWGAPGDIPVAGDWDGDGHADPAVFRPGTGQWWILPSAGGGARVIGWERTATSRYRWIKTATARAITPSGVLRMAPGTRSSPARGAPPRFHGVKPPTGPSAGSRVREGLRADRTTTNEGGH